VPVAKKKKETHYSLPCIDLFRVLVRHKAAFTFNFIHQTLVDKDKSNKWRMVGRPWGQFYSKRRGGDIGREENSTGTK